MVPREDALTCPCGKGIFGEEPSNNVFPSWYFEAEACNSNQGSYLGPGLEEGLPVAPFEPLDTVSDKFLMLKTVFLLAIFS